MINIYLSDTEAVEACICRLNVMWWCDVSRQHYSAGFLYFIYFIWGYDSVGYAMWWFLFSLMFG